MEWLGSVHRSDLKFALFDVKTTFFEQTQTVIIISLYFCNLMVTSLVFNGLQFESRLIKRKLLSGQRNISKVYPDSNPNDGKVLCQQTFYKLINTESNHIGRIKTDYEIASGTQLSYGNDQYQRREREESVWGGFLSLKQFLVNNVTQMV